MKKYIDAEKACEIIKQAFAFGVPWSPNGIIDDLNAISTGDDVQEVRRGKWVVREKDCATYCSECHYAGKREKIGNGSVMLIVRNQYKSNYCPNCGAKMDLEVTE